MTEDPLGFCTPVEKQGKDSNTNEINQINIYQTSAPVDEQENIYQMIIFNLVDSLDNLKLVAIVGKEFELPRVFAGLRVNGVLWRGREIYYIDLPSVRKGHSVNGTICMTRYFPFIFGQHEPFLPSVLCLRYVLVMDTGQGRGVCQGAMFEGDLPRRSSRYRIPEIYEPVLLQSSLNINSIQSKLGRIRHGTTGNKDLSKYWLWKKNQRTAYFLGFRKCYKKVPWFIILPPAEILLWIAFLKSFIFCAYVFFLSLCFH